MDRLLRTRPGLAVFFILLAACSQPSDSSECGRAETASPLVENVSTHVVAAVDIPRGCDLPGTIVSDDRVELSSRVVGFIQGMHVQEGQNVSRGELLVQIESTTIEQNIRQAQAQVDATFQELDDAERDVVRFEKLAKSGAIAEDTLTKSKVKRDVVKAAHETTLASLQSAQSERLYAEIRSPVDGVVVKRNKQRGDMTTVGEIILAIESRNKLLFRVYAPESHVGQLFKGMTSSVRIDALPGRNLSGIIERIVPSGDVATRRYQVDIALPTGASLLPGMFGRTDIVLSHERTLAIPKQARLSRGGLEGVYVIDAQDVAKFRMVRFGREHDELVEVGAGLSEGEVILSSADSRIHDGVRVIVNRNGAR